jgi:hypothetical protein
MIPVALISLDVGMVKHLTWQGGSFGTRSMIPVAVMSQMILVALISLDVGMVKHLTWQGGSFGNNNCTVGDNDQSVGGSTYLSQIVVNNT